MSVKVLVPTVLQKYTDNQAVLECDGSNVKELVETLEQNYPGFKGRLRDEEGKLRRFLNFYVNSEDIRFLENEKTSLQDGDEVSIVPAVAGGWTVKISVKRNSGNACPRKGSRVNIIKLRDRESSLTSD